MDRLKERKKKGFLWVCKSCGNKWLSASESTECQFCRELKEVHKEWLERNAGPYVNP